MESFVLIQYDEYIMTCENSWALRIDGKDYHFPFSICDLDEDGSCIIAPLWWVEKQGLEAYVLE